MAKTYKNIESTKQKIFNPSAIYVVPFADNVEGENYYKLTEVIQDSTSLTQDDPETTDINNEFGSAPILSNTKLGAYQFAADVADSQAELLEKLCGYVKGTTDTDRVFAPAQYAPIFAKVALAFKVSDQKEVACVLPKVQLNSKITLESLSSNMGTLRLAGTGQNVAIQDGETTHETPFYIDYDFKVTEL